MQNNSQRINEIMMHWFDGSISDPEYHELWELSLHPEFERQIPPALKAQWERQQAAGEWNKERSHRIGHNIMAAYPVEESSSGTQSKIYFLQRSFVKYAAAILLLVIGVVIYFIYHTSASKSEMALSGPSSMPAVLKPGSDKAILTLSDGHQVVLNDSTKQIIADGKIAISKDNGILTYNAMRASSSEASANPYNTMTTPRGGQYKIVLPDGSEVWLNAASSLRYPTAFTGKTRQVELTGEGYFSIQEDKSRPFIVRTAKMDVQVLGTEFNVNAYPDEPVVAATLVNGAVKVSAMGQSSVINPGQQAAVAYSGNALQTLIPKMDDVLAWRAGKFRFYEAPVQAIMRQISRWYDVDVTYKGDVPALEFSGSLLRAEDPMILLHAFEQTGVIQFKVEGKKITVIAVNKPKP